MDELSQEKISKREQTDATVEQDIKAFSRIDEQDADMEFQDGNIENALVMYFESLQKNEENEYAHLKLIRCFAILRDNENLQLGLPHLRRISATTKDPDLLLIAADTYAILGDKDMAIACLTKLTNIYPEDPMIWIMMGNLYEILEEWEFAEEAYRQAFSFKKYKKELMPNYINFLINVGRMTEAEERLRLTMVRNPGYVVNWYLLDRLINAKQGPVRVQLLPEDPILRMTIHDMLSQSSNLGTLIAELMARQTDSDSIHIHYLIAQVYINMNHLEIALKYLSQILKADPTNIIVNSQIMLIREQY